MQLEVVVGAMIILHQQEVLEAART